MSSLCKKNISDADLFIEEYGHFFQINVFVDELQWILMKWTGQANC